MYPVLLSGYSRKYCPNNPEYARNTGEILNCYLNNAFMCAETKLRAVDSSVL